MGRRSGHPLSVEDRALWSAVARTAVPLRATPLLAPPDPTPLQLAPRPPRQVPEVSRQPARTVVPTPPLSAYVMRADPVTTLGPATPGLDRRTAERLRKGKIDPDAKVDLHGHTLDRAHGVLHGFILQAHARALRCVLVITGKGRPRDDEGLMLSRTGVLKDSVPRWLTQAPLGGLVVGVYPAHARHGGGGAFYVYLRKAR